MTSAQRDRYEELANFLNIASKSGYLDARMILKEMATLLGIPEAIV